MKRELPSPLFRHQPKTDIPSLFNTRRQIGITRCPSGYGYVPIFAPWQDSDRTHQQRMANLDAVTIHVTDNTIQDQHPLRRIYSRADVTPRKARIERERQEIGVAIKSIASAIIGAIILGAGIIAGFFLSSLNQ